MNQALNTTTTNATEAPNRLLDIIIKKMGVKNDAALSRAMGVTPPVISKIRHGVIKFGDSMMIRTHDLTDMSLKEIRGHLGIACFVRADRAAV